MEFGEMEDMVMCDISEDIEDIYDREHNDLIVDEGVLKVSQTKSFHCESYPDDDEDIYDDLEEKDLRVSCKGDLGISQAENLNNPMHLNDGAATPDPASFESGELNLIHKQMDLYNELLIDEIESKQQKDKQGRLDYDKVVNEKTALKESVDSMQVDMVKLQAENMNLQKNICSLYKTAKAEVNKKDEIIAELRRELDGIIFRRNRLLNGQPSTRKVNQESRFTSKVHDRISEKKKPKTYSDKDLDRYNHHTSRSPDLPRSYSLKAGHQPCSRIKSKKFSSFYRHSSSQGSEDKAKHKEPSRKQTLLSCSFKNTDSEKLEKCAGSTTIFDSDHKLDEDNSAGAILEYPQQVIENEKKTELENFTKERNQDVSHSEHNKTSSTNVLSDKSLLRQSSADLQMDKCCDEQKSMLDNITETSLSVENGRDLLREEDKNRIHTDALQNNKTLSVLPDIVPKELREAFFDYEIKQTLAADVLKTAFDEYDKKQVSTISKLKKYVLDFYISRQKAIPNDSTNNDNDQCDKTLYEMNSTTTNEEKCISNTYFSNHCNDQIGEMLSHTDNNIIGLHLENYTYTTHHHTYRKEMGGNDKNIKMVPLELLKNGESSTNKINFVSETNNSEIKTTGFANIQRLSSVSCDDGNNSNHKYDSFAEVDRFQKDKNFQQQSNKQASENVIQISKVNLTPPRTPDRFPTPLKNDTLKLFGYQKRPVPFIVKRRLGFLKTTRKDKNTEIYQNSQRFEKANNVKQLYDHANETRDNELEYSLSSSALIDKNELYNKESYFANNIKGNIKVPFVNTSSTTENEFSTQSNSEQEQPMQIIGEIPNCNKISKKLGLNKKCLKKKDRRLSSQYRDISTENNLTKHSNTTWNPKSTEKIKDKSAIICEKTFQVSSLSQICANIGNIESNKDDSVKQITHTSPPCKKMCPGTENMSDKKQASNETCWEENLFLVSSNESNKNNELKDIPILHKKMETTDQTQNLSQCKILVKKKNNDKAIKRNIHDSSNRGKKLRSANPILSNQTNKCSQETSIFHDKTVTLEKEAHSIIAKYSNKKSKNKSDEKHQWEASTKEDLLSASFNELDKKHEHLNENSILPSMTETIEVQNSMHRKRYVIPKISKDKTIEKCKHDVPNRGEIFSASPNQTNKRSWKTSTSHDEAVTIEKKRHSIIGKNSIKKNKKKIGEKHHLCDASNNEENIFSASSDELNRKHEHLDYNSVLPDTIEQMKNSMHSKSSVDQKISEDKIIEKHWHDVPNRGEVLFSSCPPNQSNQTKCSHETSIFHDRNVIIYKEEPSVIGKSSNNKNDSDKKFLCDNSAKEENLLSASSDGLNRKYGHLNDNSILPDTTETIEQIQNLMHSKSSVDEKIKKDNTIEKRLHYASNPGDLLSVSSKELKIMQEQLKENLILLDEAEIIEQKQNSVQCISFIGNKNTTVEKHFHDAANQDSVFCDELNRKLEHLKESSILLDENGKIEQTQNLMSCNNKMPYNNQNKTKDNTDEKCIPDPSNKEENLFLSSPKQPRETHKRSHKKSVFQNKTETVGKKHNTTPCKVNNKRIKHRRQTEKFKLKRFVKNL